MKLVTGNSNRALADAVATYLEIPLTAATVKRFADNEIFVEIHDNVRGEDVFILQSTSYPANDNLMELLILTDALHRSSARRITAAIPYFGYARQDRRSAGRTPISAKLVANLITKAGVNRVITLDLHAAQIQGFFDIPTDNLYAAPLFTRDIKQHYRNGKTMIVSPDVGGVARARAVAQRLGADLAIVDKRRPRAGVSDLVDSGGTLVNAAEALLKAGATGVSAYITHAVLSDEAPARIAKSKLKELVITDSIEETEGVKAAKNIRRISIASLIGEAIARTASEQSVSSLFD
jgi:ribose-phosphate pyrophosphokinase